MRLYIVINETGGSSSAIAAFSNEERAAEYVGKTDEKNHRVKPLDVSTESQFSTLWIYAVHETVEDDRVEITGYHFNRYDAEESSGYEGQVTRLEIDQEPESEDSPAGPEPPATEVVEPVAPRPAERRPRRKRARGEQGAWHTYRITKLIFSLILVAVVWSILRWTQRPDYEWGENLESVEWLPTTAHNISFYRDARFTIFEFSISLNGFQDWATSSGYKPARIGKEPVKIARYRFYLNEPIEGFEQMDENQQYEVWQEMTMVLIDRGLADSIDGGDSGP